MSWFIKRWRSLSLFVLTAFATAAIGVTECRGDVTALASTFFILSLVIAALAILQPRWLRQKLAELVRPSDASRTSRNLVLFVTSNGAGLGHLTRVDAVRKALNNSEYHILTMSTGHRRSSIPRENVTYFPSQAATGFNSVDWNRNFERFFRSLVEVYCPSKIVFDGSFVYRPVTRIARKNKIPIIWIQRGCWKDGVDRKSVQRHNAIYSADEVIIPGDYGCEEYVDFGPNVRSHYVSPVISTPISQVMSREAACKALGLAPDRSYVLVQLGAGVINNIESDLAMVTRLIRKTHTPVLTKNPLSLAPSETGVILVEAYPIAPYLKAFDYAVQAAGYNTVQESVAFGLPTIFIPNLETQTDDQLKRARGIQAAGLGMCAVTQDEIKSAVINMSDKAIRREIEENLSRAIAPTGAQEIADLLEPGRGVTSLEDAVNGSDHDGNSRRYEP